MQGHFYTHDSAEKLPLLARPCCVTPQGVFIPGQVAAAAALLARNSNLSAVLCQFFREDLLAWTSRKGKGSSGGVHLPSDTLKGLVVKNTQQVRWGAVD
jgi:hypothetical protein